ncbi:BtrH N-terminal domain-containing protein [Cohnella panacarvi]|uniref:BtrH N-terminal domain-containing protein n=1 Tax=Cohnella panacarvi TaxID=400776 RepID=UPI00047DC5BE|nr:BtrH N-terminal domain-containing protein [Cohnella panacarvi]
MSAPYEVGAAKSKRSIPDVPRYFVPHVGDCFANAYGAVAKHMGLNPELVLADYLCFMYDEQTEYIGINFLGRYSTSVEFTEEELNSSMEFAYLPPTAIYLEQNKPGLLPEYKDRLQIRLLIQDDPAIAYRRTKELLDAGRPVIAVVDLHGVSYHRAFKREHGIHAVVLTGYDEENQIYELFDKYKLSSSDFDGTLPMEEIMQARSALCLQNNPITGPFSRPVRNLWMELEVGEEFRVTEERIRAIIRQSSLRMKGLQPVHGRVCGLERLEAFRQSLLDKKEIVFDELEVYRFRTYYNRSMKGLSRQRKRFQAFIQEASALISIPGDVCAELNEELEASAMRWDIAANLSLKLGIARKPAILDELCEQLRFIREAETKVVGYLDRCAE